MIIGPNIPRVKNLHYLFDPSNKRSYVSGSTVVNNLAIRNIQHSFTNFTTGSLINGVSLTQNDTSKIRNFSLDGTDDFFAAEMHVPTSDMGPGIQGGATLVFFAKINEYNTAGSRYNYLVAASNVAGNDNTFPLMTLCGLQNHTFFAADGNATDGGQRVDSVHTTSSLDNPNGWNMFFYRVSANYEDFVFGCIDVNTRKEVVLVSGGYRSLGFGEEFHVAGIGGQYGGTFATTNMELGPVLLYNVVLTRSRNDIGYYVQDGYERDTELLDVLDAYRHRFVT